MGPQEHRCDPVSVLNISHYPYNVESWDQGPDYIENIETQYFAPALDFNKDFFKLNVKVSLTKIDARRYITTESSIDRNKENWEEIVLRQTSEQIDLRLTSEQLYLNQTSEQIHLHQTSEQIHLRQTSEKIVYLDEQVENQEICSESTEMLHSPVSVEQNDSHTRKIEGADEQAVLNNSTILMANTENDYSVLIDSDSDDIDSNQVISNVHNGTLSVNEQEQENEENSHISIELEECESQKETVLFENFTIDEAVEYVEKYL